MPETSAPANMGTLATIIGQIVANRRSAKIIAPYYVQAIQEGRCEDAMALAIRFGDANDQTIAKECLNQRVAAQRSKPSNFEQQLAETWANEITPAIREGRCNDAKAAARRLSPAFVDQVIKECVNLASAAPSNRVSGYELQLAKKWENDILPAIKEGRCLYAKDAASRASPALLDQAIKACSPAQPPAQVTKR